MVDLCNVNKLEKVSFNVEGTHVNRVQLNVICWLSKTRMENLNGSWGTCLGGGHNKDVPSSSTNPPNKKCITLSDLKVDIPFLIPTSSRCTTVQRNPCL